MGDCVAGIIRNPAVEAKIMAAYDLPFCGDGGLAHYRNAYPIDSPGAAKCRAPRLSLPLPLIIARQFYK